jgi:hypothetical protein
MTATAPTANAGFVFFNIPGLHPGESARVAEQIVCANILCSGFDYQFYVLNTGIRPIDGVAFGLGVFNAGAQIAGGALTLATAPLGGDGPFPNVAAGNFGGTLVLGIPAGGVPVANGPAAWGFEEWQDAPGALPATFYIVRWYSPIQGLGAASLGPNRWTRLDLFTVFGPAGGSGAVDPPDITQPYFSFETTNGDLSSITSQSDWPDACTPGPGCTPEGLTELNADSLFGAASEDTIAPEPGTIGLLGAGMGLVFWGKFRRKAA